MGAERRIKRIMILKDSCDRDWLAVSRAAPCSLNFAKLLALSRRRQTWRFESSSNMPEVTRNGWCLRESTADEWAAGWKRHPTEYKTCLLAIYISHFFSSAHTRKVTKHTKAHTITTIPSLHTIPPTHLTTTVMYCSRPVARSPSVVRIINTAPRRNASFFPGFPSTSLSSPFFGRAASQDPFRALDRMLEDFSSPSFPFAPQQLARQPTAPVFQPRFDVRENNGTYELRGEMPGVDGKDLEVEFTDGQTLIVRGRTERESSSGTPPQAVEGASIKGKERAIDETPRNINAAATDAEKPAVDSDATSNYSTGSYQRPRVEDAEGTESATEAKDTPATTPGAEQPIAPEPQPQTEATPAQASTPAPTQPQPHYWISERSTGSFQRVFKFPHRVDQAAVTASLKNGILSIIVPKAAKPEPRRIQVE